MVNIKNLIKIALLSLPIYCLFFSCSDKFDEWENHEPDWLGENIYDYLKSRGDCNYYVRLIEDCGYKETMQRTGSNTLFFSSDAAFERFFQNNASGIKSYEEFSDVFKNMLLRLSMLNNAYLIDRLSYNEKGSLAFRRTTYLQPTDTIPLVNWSELPKNPYFSKFSGEDIFLLQDHTQWTLVQFFPSILKGKNISDEDFAFITGEIREENDAFLYNSRIIARDIVCKNGYLHEMDELLLPPDNMAQYIRKNKEVSIFNSLMDRFAYPVPYSFSELTGDTIFSLRYFNSSTVMPLTTDGSGKLSEGLLYYDPGWNKFQATVNSPQQEMWETDMGAMLVPTNEAMQAYFSPGGEGEEIYNAFGGSWDNVPTSIVADIIANHQRYSFINSLPSRFSSMKDEAGYDITINKDEDIKETFISRNGLIYVVNKVFPPLDYRTVMGPVKVDQDTRIFNLAIGDSYCQFKYYLRSIQNLFQFFVTPDLSMIDYLDPVSLGYTDDKKARWRFAINESGNIIARRYNAITGERLTGSDSIVTEKNIIKNRLEDILNQQTIIGTINHGQEYYITKGGAPLRVKGNSVGNLVVGGGNIEQDKELQIIKTYENKSNGSTYYLSGIVESATVSVYRTLANHTEFSEFFRLCNASWPEGADMDIFTNLTTDRKRALDSKVKFFDLFNYTIYVPTNQAIQNAITSGIIPDPDKISELAGGDLEIEYELYDKLRRFLRYHFQDNSVFIKGEILNKAEYKTATINNKEHYDPNYPLNKFFPIRVTHDGDNITLYTHKGGTAKVIKDNNLYNLIARDIVVNHSSTINATQIETSSWVVIHQVDDVLLCE